MAGDYSTGRSSHLLIPLILLLPVLWALIPGGLPNTADGTVHFVRATEMVLAWQDGIWLPRWSLNLGYGYGIPLFVYAPPLPYLLTAGFHQLGLPPEAAFKAMLITGLLLAANGAYRLGHVLAGRWGGAIAAAGLVYAPVYLRELFVQGNAGQLLAWSFPAWALWAVIRLYQAGRPRHVIVLALALTGAFLSHNVVALLLPVVVASAALWLWAVTRQGRGLLFAAGGSLLGLALSAWFAIPALLESAYAAFDRIVASDYHSRFVPLAELLAWPPRLDTGTIDPYIPRTLGLPLVLAAALGLGMGTVWLWRTRLAQNPTHTPPSPGGENHARIYEESAPSLLGEGWGGGAQKNPSLTLPPGGGNSPQVDRDLAPLLSQERHGIDRPEISQHGAKDSSLPHEGSTPSSWGEGWRGVYWGGLSYLTLLALFCGVMAHAVSAPLWEALPFVDLFEFPMRWHGLTIVALSGLAAYAGLWARRWPLLGMALIGLLLGSALVNLYPHKLAVGARIMTPHAVARYEVRSGAVGTTSLGEFNPAAVTRLLTTSPLVEAYLADQPVDRLAGALPPGAAHQVLEVTAHRQHYTLTLPAPATITLALHDFPGWRATVNGTPTPIRPQPETGLITLDLPAGAVDLVLTFGPTPLRRAMQTLSALAWIGLGVGVVVMGVRGRKSWHAPRLVVENGRVLGPVALVALGVWGLQGVGGRWFQLHSAPDQALPAQVITRADFGDLFRLLGMDNLPEVVRAGEALPVVVYWRALDDSDDNFSVELHLVDPVTGATAASLRQVHPEDIPTSGWATGLYVRNDLTLPLPADLLPIQYSVRVGFYDPTRDRYLPTAQGNLWEVGRVWVEAATAPQPPAGPRVQFGDSLHLLGVHQTPDAITLYWRTDAPLPEGLTIFIHLLDANGQVIGQLDGAPYANRYPLAAWRPDQVIEETRRFAQAGIDPTQVARAMVGVYQLADGVRLSAVREGSRLPDDALVIHREP